MVKKLSLVLVLATALSLNAKPAASLEAGSLFEVFMSMIFGSKPQTTSPPADQSNTSTTNTTSGQSTQNTDNGGGATDNAGQSSGGGNSESM